MRGTVIGFDAKTASGAINGLDGARYEFTRAEWRADTEPTAGDEVDFGMEGQTARAIFLITPAPVVIAPKESWARFLFSSNGRISRKQYWLRFALPVWALGIVVIIVESALGQEGHTPSGGYAPGWMYSIYTVALIWPSVAIGLKRIHDHARSGWFYLVLLIPVVQLWPAIEILFLRGTKGPNRFGPDPVVEEPAVSAAKP